MIRRPQFYQALFQQVAPTLDAAYVNHSKMVELLRDPGVRITTVEDPDGGQSFPIRGWMRGLADWRRKLTAFGADHRQRVTDEFPALAAALEGYLASSGVILAAYRSLLARYTTADGHLTVQEIAAADRDALAAMIEAELEA